jgi:hypothetical protein
MATVTDESAAIWQSERCRLTMITIPEAKLVHGWQEPSELAPAVLMHGSDGEHDMSAGRSGGTRMAANRPPPC